MQAENSGPHARPQAAQRRFHASFTHGQRQRRGNFTLGLMGASKSKNDFSNQVAFVSCPTSLQLPTLTLEGFAGLSTAM